MKIKSIVYWVATGLLSVIMLYALYNYIFNFDIMTGAVQSLQFPAFLLYILIITKTLGLIAVLSNIKGVIKEWAYAGFFFDFVLAFLAHYIADDGAGAFAVIALVLLAISYFTGKQVRPWLIRG